jgi:hypothetical protein
VGGVAVSAAGHADVRRRGAGGLADEQVRVVDGVALGAVHGGGEGELDVASGVLGGQAPLAAPTADEEGAVADGCDGPGVAVGDAQVAVVAAGRDAVALAELFAGGRCQGRRVG